MPMIVIVKRFRSMPNVAIVQKMVRSIYGVVMTIVKIGAGLEDVLFD